MSSRKVLCIAYVAVAALLFSVIKLPASNGEKKRLVTIISIPVTVFGQNCRIVFEDESRQAVIVDPGGAPEQLLSVIERNSLNITHVLLTHAHLDHGGAIRPILERLSKMQKNKPVFVAHQCETLLRERLREQALLFGVPSKDFENVPEPDVYAEDGGELNIGTVRGKLLHAPGHSPGHVMLLLDRTAWSFADAEADGSLQESKRGESGVLLSGDVLFAGSIGRTDFYGGDYDTLLASIKEKIFVLPDDTVVLPGHGPETTVGREKKSNPFLH